MAEYIEREAAFNAIFNLVPKVDDDGYCWVIRGDAARAIDTIPAADVRPVVKARWNVGADGWECSNCTIEANNTYPICPYCGAEMKGES